ncbi:MBL fold metallo-hydrolase [Ilumatobacter sp.]|uniref:MBL fold metallo-hydrolase n=1 Tax=Ilumatobacter sp. TaxID=1967498 RepID=UPI003C352E33
MNDIEKPRHLPVRIAEETFVIQDTQGEGVAPSTVHLNAMIIRGREPIVVDTGSPINSDRYLEDLFGLVDPNDVKWVFLSHDDIDHFGNLQAVMDHCTSATLVTTWFAMERLACSALDIAPNRWRWVDDGEAFDAGDRTMVAVRPPLYDSPTTRGLLDTRTGVYWASDCFAAPVTQGTADVGDLDADEWRSGFMQFQQWNSPWSSDLDLPRYHRTVDRFVSHDIRVIASCHGPAIHRSHLEDAYEMLRAVPESPVDPQPGMPVLEEILASMATETTR